MSLVFSTQRDLYTCERGGLSHGISDRDWLDTPVLLSPCYICRQVVPLISKMCQAREEEAVLVRDACMPGAAALMQAQSCCHPSPPILTPCALGLLTAMCLGPQMHIIRLWLWAQGLMADFPYQHSQRLPHASGLNILTCPQLWALRSYRAYTIGNVACCAMLHSMPHPEYQAKALAGYTNPWPNCALSSGTWLLGTKGRSRTRWWPGRLAALP